MDIFDGRYKDWTLDSGCVNKERGNLENLGNLGNLGNSLNLCNIDITKRIGMESTMAEVYKIDINNESVAIKVLPILNDDSYKNNEKEFYFASLASNLVLSENSKYFPIVYTNNLIFCKETYFFGSNKPKLKFYEKSLRYQQFKVLINAQTNDKIIEKIISYKKNFLDAEKIVKLLDSKRVKYDNFVYVDLPTKICSHLLVSELACFDLEFYLDNYTLSEWQLLNLLQHIFLAIQDMHVKLNILHNDLHLGNILIIKENGEYIPLIHDFGKSKFFDQKNSENTSKDILTFISHFSHFMTNINDENNLFKDSIIFKHLDKVVDICIESTNYYPIIDIVEYWNKINEF